MANAQHIEWLLEGVEAWNARREREEFVPDFEGADLSVTLGDLFRQKDVIAAADVFSPRNLDGYNLQRANFRDAICTGISFVEADLKEGDFSNCDVDQADFKGADVSSSRLVLAGLALDDNGTRLNVGIGRTDLLEAKNLTQGQLDSMQGDGETRIPEGLKPPEHWPEFEPDEQNNPTDHVVEAKTDQFEMKTYPAEITHEKSNAAVSSLRSQAIFILQTANAAQAGAKLAASQIETAVAIYCNESGENGGEDIEILIEVASSFRQFALILESSQTKEATIQEQQARIEQLEKEVINLTEILKTRPSAMSQTLIAAFGAAGGSAITATAAYFIGPQGAEVVNNLWQLIGPTNPLLSTPSSPHIG